MESRNQDFLKNTELRKGICSTNLLVTAYDALIGAGTSWEELCLRGVLHGGDNDSTGIIAGSCWGAMYGFEGVPEVNYKNLEYRDRLVTLGKDLYKATM